MDVQLVLEKGAPKRQIFRLRTAETIIGRRHGCNLRIPSAQVSRRHCRLRFHNDLLTVEDLYSANGTFLNGVRLTDCQVVRPGDRLEVGPVKFRIHYQLTQAAIGRLRELGQALVLKAEDAADLEVVPVEIDDKGITVNTEGPEQVEVPVERMTKVAKKSKEKSTAGPDDEVNEVDFLDDGQDWHLPLGDDLRDILSRLDDK